VSRGRRSADQVCAIPKSLRELDDIYNEGELFKEGGRAGISEKVKTGEEEKY